MTVELSKFKKRQPATLLDLREEWCYFLAEGRRDTIKDMLKKGMDVSLLSKFTDLSEEEICKLKESLS